MTTPKMILVGRIAGAFGVKGEVRLSAYTAAPQALLGYKDLKREDGSHAVTVLSGRVQGADLIVRLEEVATKEQADAMRGLRLHVAREALPEPEDDEFYLADLIGLKVEAPDGKALGKVKAVQDFGAGDILEIDPGTGGPTWYLPFTREAVPTVDIAGGKVIGVKPSEVMGDPQGGKPEPD